MVVKVVLPSRPGGEIMTCSGFSSIHLCEFAHLSEFAKLVVDPNGWFYEQHESVA